MPGCATTCSGWRRFRPTATTCRRAWDSSGRRLASRRRSSAEAAGCSTTACRSGRWPMRCSLPATRRTSTDSARSASSLSPTQSGAPVFPNILSQVVPTVTLVNFTTMDRDLENAYSRQASLEVEHQIGRTATVSVGYHYLRGLKLIMSVNQNVPTASRRETTTAAGRIPTMRTTANTRRPGRSEYDGLHVSFVQRPAAWGSYRVSYTYSKSMNNMGEAFFSSPIDPLDISKDWGRSDDDQRHRLVIHASVNTSMAPATTAWERLSHGFTVSGVVQYYSALPYNITSGVTTIQGTPGRPIVDRRVHRAERRRRQRVFDGEPQNHAGVSRLARSDRGARRGVQPARTAATTSPAIRSSGPARIRPTRTPRLAP